MIKRYTVSGVMTPVEPDAITTTKWVKEHDHIKEVERLKGGWISVDDRLPDGITSVIALLKNNAVMEFTYSSLSKHWFRTGGSDECPDNPVTHWMPLPEPPEDV